MTITASAVDWLLDSDEPGIVFHAKRDLLGEEDPAEASRVLEGPWVRALLAGQQEDGGFGVHAYGKWSGAHWRLVSLVELGVPAGDPRCVAAAETVLAWLTGKAHRAGVRTVDGLVRRCASQEGNALAVCCRLGLAADPRVRLLAESLVGWQWPDGGWNCDPRATGRRSSFHESLAPAWGLHEYWAATGEPAAKEAADRTAELFLDHRLFRRHGTGEPIHPSSSSTTRPTGTTTSCRPSWCSRGWVWAATRARPMRSSSSTTAASPTVAGAPAGAGGSHRTRRKVTSRSWTGAARVRTRW